MKKVLVTCILLSLFGLKLYSQDSVFIHNILKKIRSQQTIADSYFFKGMFPSYISKKPLYSNQKKDNNVFYNALVGYTLKSLKSHLSFTEQHLIDSIELQSEIVFPRFKNMKGRNTYNFYRTDSVYEFPFNKWIPKLRSNLNLPDDLDCTALALICEKPPDSIVKQIHLLMQGYVNKGILKTTYKLYRNEKAYSVWFGKKIPVVFDISVLCNVLCFVQQNNLTWTSADSASLKLIIKTINNNDHVNNPLFVSPYYGKTSIILYHLARLMEIKPISELPVLKQKLAEEAKKQFDLSKNNLEKIILNTCLMKWGYKVAEIPNLYDPEFITDIHQNDFPFFIGNLPSYMKQPLKGILTKTKTWQYYYYCNAFNDLLLLEYLVWKNKTIKYE